MPSDRLCVCEVLKRQESLLKLVQMIGSASGNNNNDILVHCKLAHSGCFRVHPSNATPLRQVIDSDLDFVSKGSWQQTSKGEEIVD